MQRGSVYKIKDSWAYRAVLGGRRRQIGGFRTKRESSTALAEALERDRMGTLYREELSFDELCERYLTQHEADPSTIEKLRHYLKPARRAFGSAHVSELTSREIANWRPGLPDGARADYTQAVRQVLNAAVAWNLLDKNPALAVPNPRRKRSEIRTIADYAMVEAVAAELSPHYREIPEFAVGTGLRPEEWIAVERRDIDREAKVLSVNRVFVNGRLKEHGKTDRSQRRVPLRARVLAALDRLEPRLDSLLLFPSPTGRHINLHNWRAREWNPTMIALELTKLNGKGETVADRGPYSMRHTYAAWALAANINTYTLCRRMGTSLKMVDDTYGHLVSDAEDYERGLLDAWDAEQEARISA